MSLLFLLPLFTGLVTGYIFKKSTDEIGQLLGIVAAISLILSLILAPWQIQIVLLFCILVSTKKLLQQNEYKLRLNDSNQEQLTFGASKEALNYGISSQIAGTTRKYRGGSYQVEDGKFEFQEREIIGKYRGQILKIHQIEKNH